MASWLSTTEGKLGATFIQIITWDEGCSPATPSDADIVRAFALSTGNNKLCGAVLLWKNQAAADKFDVALYAGGPATVRNFPIHGVTDAFFNRCGRSLDETKSIFVVNYQYGKQVNGQLQLLDPVTEASLISKKFKAEFPAPGSTAGSVIGKAFGKLPGIVVKVILANPETNTFGGCYFFTNPEGRDGYADGSNLIKPLPVCPCLALNVPKSIAGNQNQKATFERYEVTEFRQ